MTPELHPFVHLARQSVRHYLDHEKQMDCPTDLPQDFQRRMGAFVTVRKKDDLRGCIGTLTPQTHSLAMEIIRNAVQAAFNDPRFPPVQSDEWQDLSFAVEVVTPPVQVQDLSDLDPRLYGLVVRSHKKQGVLLPAIEGVETTEDQIRICRLKGRIKDEEPQEFFRFEVESYH